MTSYKADKFMEEHPEVAVRTFAKVDNNDPNVWRVWNDIRIHGEEVREHHAFTRESAIAGYRDIFHPVKPKPSYPDMMRIRALAESAKYRKIVEAYEYHRSKVRRDGTCKHADIEFPSRIYAIVSNDLKVHCTTCGQELSKTPIREVP